MPSLPPVAELPVDVVEDAVEGEGAPLRDEEVAVGAHLGADGHVAEEERLGVGRRGEAGPDGQHDDEDGEDDERRGRRLASPDAASRAARPAGADPAACHEPSDPPGSVYTRRPSRDAYSGLRCAPTAEVRA